MLSAGWLGNAWDLYLSQIPGRAVSHARAFGPAWLARGALDRGPRVTHRRACALFRRAAALWAAIRTIEPQRTFSRLCLATALVLVYFPTELIVEQAFG